MVRATLVLLTLILASLAASGCQRVEPTKPSARPVLVERPLAGAQGEQNSYAGEVRARYETDLAFRIAGKLEARLVEVGQQVRAGDVLARLDPEDAALAAEASRAGFSAAEADLRLARSEMERQRSMLQRGFISQALYETHQNAVSAAEARVEQARSQYAVSRNQSAYTTLRADADGVITQVMTEEGQVIAAGQPVFRLARGDELEVVIALPENRLAELEQAESLAVSLWSSPGRSYTAQLRERAPEADPVTRTYATRFSLTDADDSVQLGMTARVHLQRGEGGDLMSLPLTALTEDGDQAAIWVVDPDTLTVSLRLVEVAAYRERAVILRAGVLPDDLVVTAGVQRLLPGQEVRLLERTRG